MKEELLNKIIPPCHKCPYKLGQVKFVKIPCPECKMNGYQTYHTLVEGKYRDYGTGTKD